MPDGPTDDYDRWIHEVFGVNPTSYVSRQQPDTGWANIPDGQLLQTASFPRDAAGTPLTMRELAVAAASKAVEHPQPSPSKPAEPQKPGKSGKKSQVFVPTPDAPLGAMSALRESGSRGSSAVGDDEGGGPSYGKYQIATKRSDKTGKSTMDEFMAYLKKKSPTLYAQLDEAGGADGALAKGAEFQAAWKKAAGTGDLTPLEHDFIKSTHYDVERSILKQQGMDINKRSKAIQQMAWSISVQHGPGGGSGLVETAIKALTKELRTRPEYKDTPDKDLIAFIDDRDLIDAVYTERERMDSDPKKAGRLAYFPKITDPKEIKGLQDRFVEERQDAQTILDMERAQATPVPQA